MSRNKKPETKLIYLLIISLIMTVAGYPAAGVFASENAAAESPEAGVPVPENVDRESQKAGVFASGNISAESPAAGETGTRYRKRVEIASAGDLIRLSAESIKEASSRGVYYEITSDIDLSGTGFEPISVFAGYLEGNGHTISGFSYTEKQSSAGFIRTVTKEGEVRNLILDGRMEPRGDMSVIGGIAGENYGRIVNCSFKGKVLGFEAAGGIVGRNMESGVISSCTNSASVNATRRSGGIAGENEGIIEYSVNMGNINADRKSAHQTVEERDGEDKGIDAGEDGVFDKFIQDTIDLKDDDLIQKYDNGLKVENIGGITGVCSGTIRESVNKGVIGYPHNGYNTGGITGYDRGIVSGCTNRGEVYGRKNTGGIAGLFEPYAVNIYSEDSLSRAMDELDLFSDRAERLHKNIGTEDDETQSHIDAVRNSSDALRQVIKDYKEYYRCKDDSVEREIRQKVDNIRNITDSIESDKYSKDTNSALQALIDNTKTVADLLSASAEARSSGIEPDMTNYIGKMANITATNTAALDTLIDKAKKADKDAKELKDDLSDLRSASNDLDDYLRGCVDDYKKDYRITSDDIHERTEAIAGEMDVLSEGLKESDGILRKDVDLLVSSLNSLNSELSGSYREIKDELQKIYDTDSVHDIFDDVSDDPDTEPKKGVLLSSDNEADIESDINGGGIAGTVTDSPDPHSDFDVVSGGQVSLKYERSEKATILNCRNNGDVTVRNDYAGGIVGRADLGAVIGSVNFGRIESSEGDYAGGIAGKSGLMIRSCHSVCEAVSRKYAGGIAGVAHSLVDNVCLSSVDPDKEFHGAIAGDRDDPDTDEADRGTVSGNKFVFRGLGAINGITEGTEAAALSYEEILSLPGIPEDFGKMTVTFKDRGKTVLRLRLPYGGSVSEDEYPPIRGNEEGKFGYWEDVDLSRIEQNMTVNSVYVDFITTIAAGDEGGQKMILGGRFYEGTELEYKEEALNLEGPGGGKVTLAVTFEPVCTFGIPDNSSFTVRYRDKGYTGKILLKENGTFREAEQRRDGDYTVFEMDAPGTFYLESTGGKRAGNIAAAVILPVAFIGIILMIFYKKGIIRGGEQKEDGRE